MCQILNLNVGNALLLKEAISENVKSNDPYDRVVPKTSPAKILSEIGISLLKTDDVSRILKRRVDLTSR